VRHGVVAPTQEKECATRAPMPKIVWTYWDQGAKAMPAFNKLCMETWRATNPEWRINVVDQQTLQRYVEPHDLPSNLSSLELRQHRADCAKLALLRRHGGIYIDSSTMVWQDFTEFTGWQEIEDGCIDLFSYYRDAPEFVENYFIACRPESPIVVAWHIMHTQFWSCRKQAKKIDKDPFFKGVDLSIMKKTKGELDYLVQHACYKKLLAQEEPCYEKPRVGCFRDLTNRTLLYNTMSRQGPLWLCRHLRRGAEKKVRKVKEPQQWNEEQRFFNELYDWLFWRDDVTLMKALESQQLPLAKFTRPFNQFLELEKRKDLLQWPNTLRRLFFRALGPQWALLTSDKN